MANSPQKQNRKKANQRGRAAEFRAGIALMLKGYRIVARRYRTKLGEIDLIVRKGDLVCFVEVKARPTVQQAVDAVTQTAKKRIDSTAFLWLGKQRNAAELSLRFDIVAVCPWRWPVHLEDAF